MFMVLSSWHSHCESSPGSFDECRMAPSGRRPKTKSDDLGCESACTGCQNLHLPMYRMYLTYRVFLFHPSYISDICGSHGVNRAEFICACYSLMWTMMRACLRSRRRQAWSLHTVTRLCLFIFNLSSPGITTDPSLVSFTIRYLNFSLQL